MENKSQEKLFKDIIIDYSQRITQSIFISSRKLKYNLPHQREYIWPEVKAANFIETILWHGEIPPVVLYEENDGLLGVIDGKQRCKAIDEFLNDGFSLQAHGLDKLWYLSGKTFSQLDATLQNRFLQAKLRCIIVRPRNENGLTTDEEECIKREIFKRYNMGISALKKEEVYMAQYLHDAITIRLKQEFEKDSQLLYQLKEVFANKSRNTETLIQHIRHLLVLSDIPVNRYAHERDDIVNKYYDYYAYHLVKEGEGKIEQLLEGFKKKLNFLMEIKQLVNNSSPWITAALTAYECIYWAMCICKKENVSLDELNNKTFKTRLANHVCGNVEGYSNSRSNYPQYINHRYELIAKFFSSQFPLSFTSYLKADREFSVSFHNRINQYMDERFGEQVKQEHFTQTAPTEFTINDILYEIKRKQFCIRPPYQRQEGMTITKASALIESILLNIKLLPIYIFVRADGVREVIDGQQRLLAIIGFLGESYTDEQGKHVKKHKFTLSIEKPVLSDICGKKYKQLTEAQKNRIQDFKLNIIEIKEIDNPGFKPEELYKRLNHKPFPIKEHTFEYWNVYIDNDLTGAIKDISNRYKWLYIRKEDKRMLNLQMITNLCYLNLLLGSSPLNLKRVKEVLHFYDSNGIIVIRIKHKANVTSILESPEQKGAFLLSLNHFENDFIEKVILLTANLKGKTTTESFRNIQLDAMLQTAGTRMSMRFIILWLVLKEIPCDQMKASPVAVRNKISKIFSILKVTGALERFEQALNETWEHYRLPMEEAV